MIKKSLETRLQVWNDYLYSVRPLVSHFYRHMPYQTRLNELANANSSQHANYIGSRGGALCTQIGMRAGSKTRKFFKNVLLIQLCVFTVRELSFFYNSFLMHLQKNHLNRCKY